MRDPYRWGWKRYAQMFYPPFLRRYVLLFRGGFQPLILQVPVIWHNCSWTVFGANSWESSFREPLFSLMYE